MFEIPLDKSLDKKHRQSYIELAEPYGKPKLIKIHAVIIVAHTTRSIVVRHRTEERQLVIDDVRSYVTSTVSVLIHLLVDCFRRCQNSR